MSAPQIMAAALVSLFTLFGGFFIAARDIEPYWIWLYHSNPMLFATWALVPPQFQCDAFDGECPELETIGPDGFETVNVENFVEQFLGVGDEVKWFGIIGLAGYIGVVFVLKTLALKFVRSGSR